MPSRTITSKYLLQNVMFSLIPIVVLGVLTTIIASGEITQSMTKEIDASQELLGNRLEEALRTIEGYMRSIIADTAIQKIVLEKTPSSETAYFYPLTDRLRDALLPHVGEDRYLDSCILFDFRDRTFVFTNNAGWNLETLKADGFLARTKELDGKINWIGPQKVTDATGTDQGQFLVARALKNLAEGKPLQQIGVLFLSFSDTLFRDISADVLRDAEGGLLVVDGSGKTAAQWPLAAAPSSVVGLLQAIPKEGVRYDRGAGFIVSRHDIPRYGWRVYRYLPYAALARRTFGIRNTAVVVCLVCLAVAFLLASIVSRKIARPLLEIRRSMGFVEEGIFDKPLPVTSDDEIGQIQERYNRMVRRIQELFAETMDKEKRKRQAELRALQYQINPHFLYNTLNSVRLVASMSGCGNVSQMLDTLIRLLRSTLGSTGTLVPLETEMANVRDYVSIQNVRYGGAVEASFLVEEGASRLLIPNLIVQPLVENAIFHGIGPKRTGGTVRIEARAHPDVLMVTVRDDGVGMDPRELERVLRAAPDREGFAGIGLSNIDERVKLDFGPAYGLAVESAVGTGTLVTLTLPRREGPA